MKVDPNKRQMFFKILTKFCYLRYIKTPKKSSYCYIFGLKNFTDSEENFSAKFLFFLQIIAKYLYFGIKF